MQAEDATTLSWKQSCILSLSHPGFLFG